MIPTTSDLERASLAELAATRAGAARVFQRLGIDFCCHGQIGLSEACAAFGLEPAVVLSDIAAESHPDERFERWDLEPLPALIDHVLARYHELHRRQLPGLLEMAQKVERVHAKKESAPRGLAAHLAHMAEELEIHMQKEERILFPLLRAGRGAMAAAPIQAMEHEHEDHGKNLARLRALAHDFHAPAEACGTWRALYLGLAELESDLMQHIHLENNVLFPRALRG